MGNDTVWMCIAAVAIVGIVALAFIFRNSPGEDTAVAYNYDEQNRLTSVVPITNKQVKLKAAE